MNPPRDCIHIEALELSTHIGVTEGERAVPQRLTVSLTLHPQILFDALEDRLERTINYSAVCQTVRALACDRRERCLLETFALEIVASVFAGFAGCAAVEVELRKYVLADTDHVAVRLTRSRPADLTPS